MHYLCSENNDIDQLWSYRAADLRLCFCICKKIRFSHDAAQIQVLTTGELQEMVEMSSYKRENLQAVTLSRIMRNVRILMVSIGSTDNSVGIG